MPSITVKCASSKHRRCADCGPCPSYDEWEAAYEKLPASRKVEVLWDALDEMQHYNGRSRMDCVVLAMGGDPEEVRTRHDGG